MTDATAVTWLTQEAYDRRSAELEHLKSVGRQEITEKIEAARQEGDLKENGGYVFHSDHSVPEDVGFGDFCRVQALARWYGRY